MPPRPPGHAPNRPEGTLRFCLTHPPPIRYLYLMKTLFQTSFSLSACGHAQAGGSLPALPEKRFLINTAELLLEALCIPTLQDFQALELFDTRFSNRWTKNL